MRHDNETVTQKKFDMNELRQSITTAEEADSMNVETGNYMELEISPGVWEKVQIPVIENSKSKDPVSILLESIWSKYDDGDGNLTHEELKQLIEDFTGHDVSEQHTKDFLCEMDKDGNMLINRTELSAFIRKGMKLSKKQRDIYAQRGAFHKTVIEFFDHVDVEIKRQNEVNLVFSKSLRK
jgi:hypothetical protein